MKRLTVKRKRESITKTSSKGHTIIDTKKEIIPGDLVIVVVEYGPSCGRVYKNTIAMVAAVADTKHLKLALYPGSFNLKYANPKKVRRPKDEAELKLVKAKFKKATRFYHARID